MSSVVAPLEGDGNKKYIELAQWIGQDNYKNLDSVPTTASLQPAVYTVMVNQSALYRESLYTFWKEQNLKETNSSEDGRYADTLRWHREHNMGVISGEIFYWPIHDIFDQFHAWHYGGSDDKDCTHFCFQIGPYDAAIERLALGIADATVKHKSTQKSTITSSFRCP